MGDGDGATAAQRVAIIGPSVRSGDLRGSGRTGRGRVRRRDEREGQNETGEHCDARDPSRTAHLSCPSGSGGSVRALRPPQPRRRSVEHTSELPSLMRTSYAFYLLNKIFKQSYTY